MIQFVLEFALVGLVGGLLGIFYRNCLKVKDQILHWWYVILSRWVRKSDIYCDMDGCHDPNIGNKLLGFIAYPLGYCIYCSTTWITFILCILWLVNRQCLPDWNFIVIGVSLASGIQHLIVVCACRFLIYKHPDLYE